MNHNNELSAYLRNLADLFEQHKLTVERYCLDTRPEVSDATTAEDFPDNVPMLTGHVDYTLTMKFKTAVVAK